jgi:Bacterial regulatory proteins, luxR family
MVNIGLSFAMIERDNRLWWLMPLFGVLMLVIAVLAAHGVHTFLRRADEAPSLPPVQPRHAPVKVRRVLPEPLSPREVEVLQQLAAGRSNQQICWAATTDLSSTMDSASYGAWCGQARHCSLGPC